MTALTFHPGPYVCLVTKSDIVWEIVNPNPWDWLLILPVPK